MEQLGTIPAQVADLRRISKIVCSTRSLVISETCHIPARPRFVCAPALPHVALGDLHISVGRIGIESEIGVTILSARSGDRADERHPQRQPRQRISRLTAGVLLDKPSPAVASEPIEHCLHRRADLALAHCGEVVEELPAARLLDFGSIFSLTQTFRPLLQDLVHLDQRVVGPAGSRRDRTRQRTNTGQVACSRIVRDPLARKSRRGRTPGSDPSPRANECPLAGG